MAAPLKNLSTEDLQKALEEALLAVAGRTVRVSVQSLTFDEMASRVDVQLSAWDKLDTDPFAGAI